MVSEKVSMEYVADDAEYQDGDLECGVIWNAENAKEVEDLYNMELPYTQYPLVFWYDGEMGYVMPRDVFVQMATAILGALAMSANDTPHTEEKEYRVVNSA